MLKYFKLYSLIIQLSVHTKQPKRVVKVKVVTE